MLGVVLWSDAKEGKAVFWCEDQGDLAYFETSQAQLGVEAQFCAGDMVQFDVSVDQRLRRASNARLVLEQAYQGLPEQLRQNATTNVEGDAAKVVPLRAFLRSDAANQTQPKKRKA